MSRYSVRGSAKLLAAVTKRWAKATEKCKLNVYTPTLISFVLDSCRMYFLLLHTKIL